MRLSKEKKLPSVQLNFIQQLSDFLDLDEMLCYDLYSVYLVRDYRGSTKELLDVLNSERHRQMLMVKLRDFYYSERIYLLRCLSYIFSFSDSIYNHIYCDVFNDFVQPLYKSDNYVHELVKQYFEISEQNLPTATIAIAVAEKQGSAWILSNLREQCELLELLLIYYKRTEHKLPDLVELLKLFKKQGFGQWQCNNRMMDETTELLVSRIGFLQVLLAIDAMELESLTENMSENKTEERVLSSGSYKDLDAIFMGLGDAVEHGPLLLMWSVVSQISDRGGDGLVIRKLGNRAVQLKVFEYLNAKLSTEPFSGRMIIADVCRNVIYGLLSAALNTFQLQTLGDIQFLHFTAVRLLDCEFIATHFWSRTSEDGLMILFAHALECFPLRFGVLIKLLTVLAKASRDSAAEVANVLQNLTSYSEALDRRVVLESTNQSNIVLLAKDRTPYICSEVPFVIQRGTQGSIFPFAGKCVSDSIRWNITYDGWKVLAGEIHLLLSQVSYGSGMIEPETVHRVILTCRLLTSLLKADYRRISSDVEFLEMMINHLYCLVQRFSLLPSPSIELLASCFEVFHEIIQWEPLECWQKLQQTGFLPYLTHHVTSVGEALRALNRGAYGAILAGSERMQGRYPVTQAFLQLLISMVEPLNAAGKLDEILPSSLFVCQEIFPVMYKYRFYDPYAREKMGQKCLTVFMKILKSQGEISDIKSTNKSFSVKDVVVHNLLFAECSHTLLDIIGTGVDVVETALANQVNALEGFGIELIALLRLALSVMNQLLMSWPEGTSTSPVAQMLSSRPAHGAERHIVATVSHYIYHRHNPDLPSQATLLLKHLALLFPMSMLSCLGNEAETIRDVYLMRLLSATESISLKVFTLEWLSICVQCQPGIIELFLNINLVKGKDDGQREYGLGRDNCLQTVLDLIEVSRQRTYRCPPELLCAASEFLHSLWKGRRQTAMTVLRGMKGFWSSVCHSLMREPPKPSDETDIKLLTVDVTNCSHIFRILSLEIYHADRKVDDTLEAELNTLFCKERLLFWSKYIGSLLAWSSDESFPKELQQCLIQLLLAWREFVVVLSSNRVENVTLKDGSRNGDETKRLLLGDVLDGLRAQFLGQDLTIVNMKLSSITSSLYLMVLKHWCSHIKDFGVTVMKLTEILAQTCCNRQSALSSVQSNVLASLMLILQHTKTQMKTFVNFDCLISLFPVVCELLQNCVQRPLIVKSSTSDKGNHEPTASSDSKFNLLMDTIHLLKELICTLLTESDLKWLTILKQFTVVQCLISAATSLLQAKQGYGLLQAIVLFFTDMCRIPEGAELLLVNGVNQQLCLLIGNLYSESSNNQSGMTDGKSSDHVLRCTIYRNYICLLSAMLETLGYSFVKDALDFIGVHQERLHLCLDCSCSLLTTEVLTEAEESCYFLARFTKHRYEWRLHLPGVLQMLMSDVCAITQRCVSLLLQPRLLQFLLDKRVQCHQDRLNLPIPSRLSVSRHLIQQTSTDETEVSSPESLQIQTRLLNIVNYCLIAMRHFSPDLYEVIMDQTLDVSPYDTFVSLGFSAPSVDQDSSPTFGTFIAIINLCLKLLAKIEGKYQPSPLKPSTPKPILTDSSSSPISRPVVMFLMENSLVLIMSQSMRYLRDINLSQRDKQLLKRELSAELNSCLMSIQRHLRCSTPTSSSSSRWSGPFRSEHSYFRVVDTFVKQILK